MKDVLVLCYHAVSERWPSELAVSPELLDAQVAGLKRRGYRATTFTRAVTDPPWGRTMAITFDDAYRSTLEHGLPVLARHEVPATVYAPTDFVGSDAPMSWPGIEEWVDGPHAGELLCLGWDGLAELAEAGWEVGSHTRSHPRLPRVDDAELARELGDSRELIAERLGRPCESIAYPYGDFDERVVQATAAAGYRAAGTLTRHAHTARPLSWPRVGVYPANRPIFFRLKTSAMLRSASVAAGRAGLLKG
jgi:peptidoglycan/xylan/chitin deacetylase (PgdA/CDA1 family)